MNISEECRLLLFTIYYASLGPFVPLGKSAKAFFLSSNSPLVKTKLAIPGIDLLAKLVTPAHNVFKHDTIEIIFSDMSYDPYLNRLR